MNQILRYSELIKLKTFQERFDYLKLGGKVGQETFGFERYLNQKFYTSQLWREIRNKIIIRDNACDLGIDNEQIVGRIYIHHLNPITVEDVEKRTDTLINPEFLICVSFNTHNAIHYGDESLIPRAPIERKPFDTCPWRKNNEPKHPQFN